MVLALRPALDLVRKRVTICGNLALETSTTTLSPRILLSKSVRQSDDTVAHDDDDQHTCVCVCVCVCMGERERERERTAQEAVLGGVGSARRREETGECRIGHDDKTRLSVSSKQSTPDTRRHSMSMCQCVSMCV
jgi:hypothetical protein